MSPESLDHLDHDVVIDFVGGLLPAERGAGVLLHAARCPRCERLLQRGAATRERARAIQNAWLASDPALAPAAARATVTDPRDRRRAAEPRAPWRRLAERLLAPRLGPLVAAGAMAALIGVILLPSLSHRAALERVHWLPGSEAEVTTRDLSASLPDSLIRLGLEAYARHDLAAARRWLSAARARGPIELVRRIYLANTLAQQGEHRDAVVLLDTLPFEFVPFDLLPEPWSGEARWTLAASLRSLGEETRADSLLIALATEPGPVGDRSRALLERR